MIASRMTEGSVIQYKNILSKLYRFLQSKADSWSRVTPNVLASYKIYLSRQPGKEKDSYIKESTQIQHWACIRAFFRYLKDIKGIANESAIIVFSNLNPSTERDQEQERLTPEELDTLWRVCSPNPLYLAIISVLFFTGLRHSELIGCNLTNLSFKKKELRVFGKGRKWRTVFLTQDCIDDLNKYLPTRMVSLIDEDALFVSSRGKRITYDQLSYIFRKLKIYIPRIRPHLLRHTFATYLLETGSTIREVQQQLGHKRLETTMRYTHIITEEMKKKHELLSKYRK